MIWLIGWRDVFVWLLLWLWLSDSDEAAIPRGNGTEPVEICIYDGNHDYDNHDAEKASNSIHTHKLMPMHTVYVDIKLYNTTYNDDCT